MTTATNKWAIESLIKYEITRIITVTTAIVLALVFAAVLFGWPAMVIGTVVFWIWSDSWPDDQATKLTDNIINTIEDNDNG